MRDTASSFVVYNPRWEGRSILLRYVVILKEEIGMIWNVEEMAVSQVEESSLCI